MNSDVGVGFKIKPSRLRNNHPESEQKDGLLDHDEMAEKEELGTSHHTPTPTDAKNAAIQARNFNKVMPFNPGNFEISP